MCISLTSSTETLVIVFPFPDISSNSLVVFLQLQKCQFSSMFFHDMRTHQVGLLTILSLLRLNYAKFSEGQMSEIIRSSFSVLS